MRLLIAGGGTGGHIYPALAVARSLLARPDGAELRWLGGHRGLEATLVPAAGIRFQRLALRSLRTVQKDIHLVLDPLRLGAAVPQAAAILARWRPAAILTTGGYVAVPVLMAASVLRIPSVLWEGNVIPGKSARFVARMASAIAVSHPATIAGLGIAEDRAFVTGTPIRRVDTVDREAARRRFGIPPGDRVLLVFGGSQAVRRFNAAVAEALPELVARVHIIHVAGESGYAAALAQKGTLPEAVRRRYQPFPFLRDEMTDALAAADLAVGRAGASTLAEAAAFGLPLAIVPYPHAAGHQIANATAHIEAGAGELIADEEFDAAALLRMAEIIADPAKHAEMSAAARALARPGAADAVADLVLAAAARRPFPDQATIDRRARGATA